jgi:acyl dehydratase
MSTVATGTSQRWFDDVAVGQELPLATYPLPMYRLVMAAGSNRDFNSIHHNSDYAKDSGAPEAYANVLFLMGMWERTVRDFIGDQGQFKAFRGFKMKRFNLVGHTTHVRAKIVSTVLHEGVGIIGIEVESFDDDGVTVGPGLVEATLPVRGAQGTGS